MSFTSQVVPIGEGWDQKSKIEEDPAYVYQVNRGESEAIGPEGSNDDPKSLFKDTFVDMAKEATQEIEDKFEDDQDLDHFKKKNKKKFYN